MFTLLSRGSSQHSIGGFENPIFDVEVSDVEKRRRKTPRSARAFHTTYGLAEYAKSKSKSNFVLNA
jgi:hypothetical protein